MMITDLRAAGTDAERVGQSVRIANKIVVRGLVVLRTGAKSRLPCIRMFAIMASVEFTQGSPRACAGNEVRAGIPSVPIESLGSRKSSVRAR